MGGAIMMNHRRDDEIVTPWWRPMPGRCTFGDMEGPANDLARQAQITMGLALKVIDGGTEERSGQRIFSNRNPSQYVSGHSRPFLCSAR
jgi:hypothetical protein